MSQYFSGMKKILRNLDTVPDRRGTSRRLHQRFHINIDTVLECENIVYKGTILDMSRQGCQISTDNEIRRKTNKVTLRYIFPGELDTRIVRGRIRWMNQKEKKFLIGIEFEKLQNL